ncbi:MAG: beta-galactosidase [Oscillospiraceae bacterium]|nr:beta-galactosidase [Oscillospiraceae bacterium]
MDNGGNRMKLADNWQILYDTYDAGEELELYSGKTPEDGYGVWYHQLDEWQPIDRLAHLQVLLADTPYWGRELRWFNNAPWWYKNAFTVPETKKSAGAALKFHGVDYYCKVWLNGAYLGEHEGYFSPFEFEVGDILKYGEPNFLIVKVWSPWDVETSYKPRNCHNVYRNMIKGTYEHADTFVQRDLNPVGIWNEVEIYFCEALRFEGNLDIRAKPKEDFLSADIKISGTAFAAMDMAAQLTCRICESDSGKTVAEQDFRRDFAIGKNRAEFAMEISRPRLWDTWDRGGQNLYELEIFMSGVLIAGESFGVRSVELVRNENEMTYIINGKKQYLRGTTYFPDNYISNMHEKRYLRDLLAIKSAGFNAARIHVHVDKPAFYRLCDQIGIAVIQDSDMNWVHPQTEEWKDRAVKVFGDMIRLLGNHPSIISWICMNEPAGYGEGQMMKKIPGPQLYAEAKRLDPDRPAIMGSGGEKDPDSGDSHNYLGSLNGENTHYTEIYEERYEKLNTEFGFDAPPSEYSLAKQPLLYKRLEAIIGDIPQIQHYQYRYVKYFIEHYRITKYAPCSGYFQFMFIDLSPQSFYGVYDWYGVPKEAQKALEESNQPVGAFMQHKDKPEALWVVNDRDYGLGTCKLAYIVTDGAKRLVGEGSYELEVGADSVLKVCDFGFEANPGTKYRVTLTLADKSGDIIAKNIYDDPFGHPPHPKGQPGNASHNFGMRLYNA